MHTDVGQWASRRQLGIVDPGARAGKHRREEVGARHLRASNGASGDALAEQLHALLEAHHVRNPESYAGLARRLHHRARLASIHRHRLLAQHGLAILHGGQYIRAVQRIRTGDEHRIHVRTGAEVRRGREGMFDLELTRRRFRLPQIAA